MERAGGVGVVYQVPPFLHTDRVRIRAELATLAGVLRASLHDPITAQIHAWHGRFLDAVRGAGEAVAPVIETFANELEAILVDPIEGHPLEEETLLGNDFCAYGKRALACYVDSLPDLLKGRSPMYPESPTPFFVVRHTVVEGALAWLKKHRPLRETAPAVRIRYEEMEKEGSLPRIPDNPQRAHQLERARRIRAEERIVREALEAERARVRAGIAAQAEARVHAMFAPLREAAARVQAEADQAVDEAIAYEQEAGERVTEEEAHWEQMARDFEQRNRVLDVRLDDLEADIPEIEQRTAVLERNIEETKRAREANKQNPWGDILMAVAIGVAYYYIPHMVASKTAGGVTVGVVCAI